jgi:hypothetical protein
MSCVFLLLTKSLMNDSGPAMGTIGEVFLDRPVTLRTMLLCHGSILPNRFATVPPKHPAIGASHHFFTSPYRYYGDEEEAHVMIDSLGMGLWRTTERARLRIAVETLCFWLNSRDENHRILP